MRATLVWSGYEVMASSPAEYRTFVQKQISHTKANRPGGLSYRWQRAT